MKLSTFGLSGQLKRNFWRILLLGFVGAMIYGLPYFRNYFYDAYIKIYHLSNAEMGSLGSMYGVMGLFSYLFGGILADKFSTKKLLEYSLIFAGLGGFLHLLTHSYLLLLGIYLLWGVTSLLTFYPALMKTVREQADDEQQSRAYGIFDGTRGLTSIFHLTVATAIFGFFSAKLSTAAGINWIIAFYSITLIICGFLIMAFFHETKKSISEKSNFHMSSIVKAAKFPAVWLIGFIMFACYTFFMSIYYFTPYASNVVGLSPVLAAAVTVSAQYFRVFAAPIGGIFSDKVGRIKVAIISFSSMAVGTIFILASSVVRGFMQPSLLILGSIIIYFATYSTFGILFSFLQEGNIPVELSGVAIGISSTIGYLPEILVPLVIGQLLDKFTGSTGYFIYFTIMFIFAIIGIILCYVWKRFISSRQTIQEKSFQKK